MTTDHVVDTPTSGNGIRVDPEFRLLIPPLVEGELDQLECNIKAEGCREPLVVWDNTLLDGHHRKTICDRHEIAYGTEVVDLPDRTAAKIWIIQNQFGRRNLAPYTRAELALKLAPMFQEQAKGNQKAGGQHHKVGRQNSAQPLKTRDELAKIAGVSHDTIAKAKVISENADEETKQALRTNQISINRAAKDLAETKKKTARQAKRVAALKRAPKLDDRIIVGDFRKNADKVADGSVSLIFTDPPYDDKGTSMLPELGAFAASKLAECGSLLCYVGHLQLWSAGDALRQHLRPWWQIACVHSGRSAVMREYGVKQGWKVVLWFVKKTRDDRSVMVSDVMSGGEEKTHHPCQQAESEAAYWIEKLCPSDGLVCDPFLGGGTTGVAAQKLKRQWIGFEIDKGTARIASGRLQDPSGAEQHDHR